MGSMEKFQRDPEQDQPPTFLPNEKLELGAWFCLVRVVDKSDHSLFSDNWDLKTVSRARKVLIHLAEMITVSDQIKKSTISFGIGFYRF